MGHFSQRGADRRLVPLPQKSCLVGQLLISSAIGLTTGSGGNEMRSWVPLIAQQLPSSETWPIKTARNGDTHTRRDVNASSGHRSILVSAREGRLNTIALQLFGLGNQRWRGLKLAVMHDRSEEVTGGSFFSLHPPPYSFRLFQRL